MVLSNKNDILAFLSPWQVNIKIFVNSGLRQAGIARPRKMALGCWFHKILL